MNNMSLGAKGRRSKAMNETDYALIWADRLEYKPSPDANTPPPPPEVYYPRVLAAAVRSLRETVKAREEEVARLQHIVDEKPLTFLRGLEDEDIEKLIHQNDELRAAISKAAHDLSFLDAALNEGDGSYKP